MWTRYEGEEEGEGEERRGEEGNGEGSYVELKEKSRWLRKEKEDKKGGLTVKEGKLLDPRIEWKEKGRK